MNVEIFLSDCNKVDITTRESEKDLDPVDLNDSHSSTFCEGTSLSELKEMSTKS